MKTLKPLILLLVMTITSNFTFAQKNKNLEKSVLWKIEHEDLKEPSYLFGTLHLMCEKDFIMPVKVSQTLDQVDALVLEVDVSDPKEMKLMQESMAKSKKISEELSPEQFAELDALVKRVMGTPLSKFDSYGISILQFVLITKMLDCTELKYAEAELVAYAAKKQKPIFSLEKAVDQIETVKNAYPKDFAFQQLMLFDSYKKDFNEAITLYNKEDISAAVNLITKSSYMNENATKLMQVDRNKAWADKMPGMMKMKSNLFAVGAAHLTNEYGLIQLLRKKGYTVTPVTN